MDGYYENENGQKYVLEFNGKFWRGCLHCYNASTVNPVNGITMGDLYQRTREKKRYLEGQWYVYVRKWECEFDREVRENDTLQNSVQQSEMINPLEPRDAFYGGRTEALTLFQKDHDISYVDVTSLYPYINTTRKIPIGHPEIVTEGFTDIQQYEGLIKCKILPPRGLYIPVLPVKMNNKLLFTLCRTCSENQQQKSCQHNDE